MSVKDRIQDKPLLFDGAMGTWYAQNYELPLGACEPANLHEPERILKIHEDYIRAGASAIRTNTFGAYPERLKQDEQKAVIEAGWQIAQTAAAKAAEDGKDVQVFADLGPAPADYPEEMGEQYQTAARLFMDCGAKNYIFETLGSDFGILETVSMIREEIPDAFVIVSFGVQPDGFTREGVYYRNLVRRMEESGIVDVTGFNCVSGARHMRELIEGLGACALPLCALPNIGYPVVRENRTYYDGAPEYFAAQIRSLAETGVAIVGGCCGTSPVHIGYLYRELEHIPQPKRIQAYGGRPAKEAEKLSGNTVSESRLFSRLSTGEKVIAVELDSPKNSDLRKFLRGAEELKKAGADALTIADCPVARARMDSSLLACKVRRELDMDVLPHMTCRDRNINATKALLLGLSAEGVRNVLTITGDPIPTSERSEVRTVYQFHSINLASYIQSLNEEVLTVPFHIFGALNINAHNFDAELKKCEKKRAAGMYGLLTQPILTEQAFENLKRARAELDLKILGGIIPVISERNALFMASEVNGIRISDEVIRLYQGKTREEAEELAYTISCEIARRIEPYVDGYYLMTPFQRTGLIARIMQKIRGEILP